MPRITWRKTYNAKTGQLLRVDRDVHNTHSSALRGRKNIGCKVSEHPIHIKTVYGVDVKFDRMLIEYCCSPSSKLGQITTSSRGCEVVRLTEEHDMTTDEGLNYALQAVRRAPPGALMLWASLPCTGGSTFQYINQIKNLKRRNVDGLSKWVDHWTLFKQLWRNFTVLASAVHEAGGIVAVEWPRMCMYWELTEVQAMP